MTEQNAALVDVTNLVQQRIVYDPILSAGYVPPPGLTLVVETPATGPSSPGYTWSGTVFIPPPTPPPPPPPASDVRAALFKVQADRIELINALKGATPVDIDNWCDANANNLPQIRSFIKALLKVIAAYPPN